MGGSGAAILLTVLVGFCQTSTPSSGNGTVALYEACSMVTMDARCPGNSSCKPHGCDQHICYCDIGYFPSLDSTSCKKVASLNETCEPTTDLCAGIFTECADNGICRCLSNTVPSEDGKNCVTPGRSLLHNTCNNSTGLTCWLSWEQECVESKCKCIGGLREATDEERVAHVLNQMQCREESFSLDICNGTNITQPEAGIATTEPEVNTTVESLTTSLNTSQPHTAFLGSTTASPAPSPITTPIIKTTQAPTTERAQQMTRARTATQVRTTTTPKTSVEKSIQVTSRPTDPGTSAAQTSISVPTKTTSPTQLQTIGQTSTTAARPIMTTMTTAPTPIMTSKSSPSPTTSSSSMASMSTEATPTLSTVSFSQAVVTTPSIEPPTSTGTGIGEPGQQDSFPEEIVMPSIAAGILLILALISLTLFLRWRRIPSKDKMKLSQTTMSSKTASMIVPPTSLRWYSEYSGSQRGWGMLPDDEAVYIN